MTLRILVIEDNHDLAETCKTALENRGHIITIARDGTECFQTYSYFLKNKNNEIRSFFNVVVLDQLIPSIGGLDVAREIQRVNPKQRIILVIGYRTETIKKLRGLEVETMNKPFTLKALIIQIEGWPSFTWQEHAKHEFKELDGYSVTSVPVGTSRST